MQQNLLSSLQEEDEEEDGEEDEEDEAEEGELSSNNPISCRPPSAVKYLMFLELPQPQLQGCCCCSFSAQAGTEQCHQQGSHREGQGFQDLHIPAMLGNSGKCERSVA